MGAESAIIHSLTCITAAIVLVLALRLPVARAFGIKAAYRLWSLIPIGALASLLPAPPQSVAIPVLFLSRSISSTPGVATQAIPADRLTLYSLVIWSAGALIFSLVQILRQRAFNRRLNTAGPCVVGIFPPRVVLPENFERRYTPAERRLILAHEYMHIARREPHVNLLVAVVRSVLWFHPLVHLAARYLRIDQELACDADVMAAHGKDSVHYARAVLKSHVVETAPALLPTCSWESHTASYCALSDQLLKESKPIAYEVFEAS